jgi:hypothetical protein
MKKLILLVVLVGGGLSITANQKGVSLTNYLAGIFPFLKPEVTVNFADEEMAGLNEQEILEDYAELDLQCTREPSGLGERVCYQEIKAINGIPANTVAFFFINDGLTSVAAVLPSSSQPQIAEYLNQEYVLFSDNYAGSGNQKSMAAWVTTSGIIVAHPGIQPPPKDARMIWTSNTALSKRRGSLAVEMMMLKAALKHRDQ